MGSHIWTDKCPYCGFEKMVVSCYNQDFEVMCQICGYEKWTEEKIPKHHDVELAKLALSKITDEEKEKVIEAYYDDRTPLVVRIKAKRKV